MLCAQTPKLILLSRGVSNRWTEINKSAQQFSGVLSEINALNESGTNQEDKEKKAKAVFLTTYGAVFVHGEVHNILSCCPKWQQLPGTLTPKKRPRDEAYDEDTPAKAERPIRVKAAKLAATESTSTSPGNGTSAAIVQAKSELQGVQNTMRDFMLLKMLSMNEENLSEPKRASTSSIDHAAYTDKQIRMTRMLSIPRQ
ncbi:unnamed protein product (mitochondrion) [Plasmodiophora brassicae]|uniref:No apical meristem-associated C-terminal domain-containing protein n=1 Tax=Plasmodiophora brassicae TaxID=37360 RepID=A0A3P3Y830_PLABS|nr:unnamed protein product [Plasmodiophora brassicae]